MALYLLKNQLYARLKNSRLFKDSFWAICGNVINKGAALVAAVVIARWLGKDMYGEYGVIRNALLYIAVFSTFGLGFSATRYISKHYDNNTTLTLHIISAGYIISLFFSGIMAIALAIFAPQLCNYLEIPEEIEIMRMTAITIVFNALCTFQIGVIAGFKQFRELAKINGVVGILTLLFTLVLTYYYGLQGAIFSLLITNILNCLLNWRLIRRQTQKYDHVKSWVNFDVIKSLVKFSLPIALQESLYTVSYWAGMLILIKMSDYGEVGLNSAATQWAAAILFIPSVLQNVMLSHLSVTEQMQEHSSKLKRMLLINFICTALPFVLILIATPLIISFYGDNFKGLGLVLNIAIAATVIRCLIQVFVQEYIATGRTWQLFAIRLIRDIFTLILTWLFISTLKEKAAFYYNLSYLIASLLCLLFLIIYQNYGYNKIYQESD